VEKEVGRGRGPGGRVHVEDGEGGREGGRGVDSRTKWLGRLWAALSEAAVRARGGGRLANWGRWRSAGGAE
jgi:hypothetical protein